MKRIITKTTYLHIFTAIVVVLALYRCVALPPTSSRGEEDIVSDSITKTETPNSHWGEIHTVQRKTVHHRILSVPNYKVAFPDSNEVQLAVANKYGVKPVQNRMDAEKRKSELVYAASNPYYHVDKLRESIPYLVPRANILLQDIGRAFFDSLYVKGVPLHQIIVTSILRTEEDVARLRSHNLNASENSCHRFGTTFDICYNRYFTVQTDANRRRTVQNDTLKWVLSEVLRDMREQKRCYIKYEVKQGCFHITTR